MKDGWSLKHLHQVDSHVGRVPAKRRSSAGRAGPAGDPENRLLWRGGVRRLDAEQIRDALFAATGELRSVRPADPACRAASRGGPIYTRIMRNTRDPLLDVFDAPYWFNSASSRDTTTTPVQSLLLINSQLMLQRPRPSPASW